MKKSDISDQPRTATPITKIRSMGSSRSSGQSSTSYRAMSASDLLKAIERFRTNKGLDASDPQIALILSLVGERYHVQGNYDDAIDYLTQALTMYLELKDQETKITQIHIQLGLVYIMQKNFPNANKALVQALEKAPKSSNVEADIYFHYGLMYQAQDNYAKAADFFNQSLAIYQGLEKSESTAQVHFHLASVYMAENNHVFAEQHFQQTVAELVTKDDKKADIAEAYLHLGLAQQALKKYPEALDAFQQALSQYNALDDQRSQIGLTQYHLGLLCFEQGSNADADNWLSKALPILEDNIVTSELANALHHLGLIQETNGNLGQALEYWNSALFHYQSIQMDKEFYTSIETLLTRIGFAHQKQENFDDAIGSFHQILELYPDSSSDKAALKTIADAYRRIGEVHLLAKNRPGADLFLHKAVASYTRLEDKRAIEQLSQLLNPPPLSNGTSIVPLESSHQIDADEAFHESRRDSLTANLCCCGMFGFSSKAKTKPSQEIIRLSHSNPLQQPFNR